MKPSLFGTSGIRGDAEKLFTKQFCFDIGQTFVSFLEERGEIGHIAVGIDPRESGPRIKKYLLQGLASAGVQLYDEGITPIPSMNWLLKKTAVSGGIMVTGSHIAPELNGVKFYAHEEEISLADQELIETIYYRLKEKKKVGEFTPEVKRDSRAQTLYTKMLLGLVKPGWPDWKVGVDCANGSQSVVMPALLKKLGLKVLTLNCNVRNNFIARDTDTDDKAKLEDLKKMVVAEKCDFGIAYDGDGDRVVFIDEKGNFVLGEYSCGLIAKESPSKVIVTPISASNVVEKLGKPVVRTKIGSPFVIKKMKEAGALFGFEPNGGAISAEIMYTRDGGSMTIKMLNLLAKFNGRFSEMIGQLPKFYMYRTKVDYQWEQKEEILNKVKQEFMGIKTERLDGLKIWIDKNTWILFRSSANAPEFRVFAESKNRIKAEQLLKDGLDLVNSVIKKYAQS